MTTSERKAWRKTALASAIVVVYLFPVYWMVATSLKTAGDVFASPPQLIPVNPVLSAYQEAVFTNSVVQRAMLSSLIIATGTTLLTLLLATPAAYALARLRLRGAGVVILLLVLSQLLPAILIGSKEYAQVICFNKFSIRRKSFQLNDLGNIAQVICSGYV